MYSIEYLYPKSIKVLDNVDISISCFERIKDFSGNFYSFTVGTFGNIIEW